MKKILTAIISCILVLIFTSAMVACGGNAGGNTENMEEEPTYYTVVFDTDGGTTIASQSVKKGEKATKPNDPVKIISDNTVYTFEGWFVGDTEYDFNAAVNGDITIKAKWNETIYYTVIFDTDGGTTIASQSVKKGEKATKPNDPVKIVTGNIVYTFKGWFVGDTEYDFNAAVNGDITIKAKWIAEKYSDSAPI